MVFKPFNTTLSETLLADAGFLSITQADHARLLTLIPEEEQTYLTIRDDLYTEIVLATNQCGTIVIDRAQGGTEARKFPRGSCVLFEITLPVVQWLICNYDCCVDTPCPGDPVKPAGSVLPAGVVGDPWEGSFVFTGSLPMTFGVTGLPTWLNATYGPNYVKVAGTPTSPGTFVISVAATNVAGANTVAVQSSFSVRQRA